MRLKYAMSVGAAAALLLSMAALRAASSPVADAAMNRNQAVLRSLLAKKADVNAPQADGATAIHWAVYNDDLATADMLIAAGANVKVANRDGATPLSLASINGNAPMIEKLVKAGADVNETQPHGETALMFAARTGKVDAINALLEHKADVNAKEKIRGTTALIWASEQGHSAAVKTLLEHGADVNAGDASIVQRGTKPNIAPTAVQRAKQVGKGTDEEGVQKRAERVQRAPAAPGSDADFIGLGFQNATRVGNMTPLHFAAREGDLETVKILVAAGAKINTQTVDGWTPLAIATQNRNYVIGSFLLDKGADPNIANRQAFTPLYLATDNRNIEGGEYPVRSGDMDHLDFIKKLLEHKADPNARAADYTETRMNFTMQWLNEDGATPFLRAAQSGDTKLMKVLLSYGADPKITTKNNTTALMVAAGIGWVEGVTFEWSPAESQEAVKMCVDLGIDVNAQDNDGRTALHGAAHKGRNETVKFLVERGAKLDTRDNGSRDTVNGELLGHQWMAVNYADGLVRVGVQSAIPHPETAALLRDLMKKAGLPEQPPSGETVCVVESCK
jgi:ankyrin repeat protein